MWRRMLQQKVPTAGGEHRKRRVFGLRCKHLGQEDEDAQEVEIDARRLWEEIPSPCWMLWFVFDVAADVQDAGIVDEIDRLSETLDVEECDDTIDPAKCAAVRQVLPWERVEALLVRAGAVQ